MTATCREPCCSAVLRRTVSELFDRGFRRCREAPYPVAGRRIADAEGNATSFSLALDGGRLRVRFQATSCATLIAYCELLSEMASGLSPGLARALTSHDLANALNGVPLHKQVRAALAVAAFRAALEAAHEPNVIAAGGSRK